MFSNLKIGVRLTIGFAVVLTLSMIITAIGIWQLHQVADATRTMMQFPLEKERLASDWNRTVSVAVIRTTAVAKSTDPSLASFFAASSAETAKIAAENLKKLEPLLATPEEKALFEKAMELRKRYSSSRDGIMKLKTEGQADAAARLLEEVYLPVTQSYQKHIADFLDLQRKQLDVNAATINEIEASSRTHLIVLAVLALALGFACAWLLTAGITRPLRMAVQAARRVADGDLTGDIAVTSADETGQMLSALRDMHDSLKKIVGQVRAGTETMGTASTQIAAGNLDLSARTEQQASSIEETASSMEQLTATVRQNAENAAQANSLANTASDIATKGGKIVSEVVDTMEDIAGSSKKIVDIIGVIDGIAFQTNILALNAAVEAARAGEQGRGFAVVAAEVRTLAQRSATAAREIKGLIDDSVSKVDNGSALVVRAGATMAEIVASIQRVNDIMAEITAASREQSAGIEQVNQAIAQMDRVTQQNAALVEQAAAAAGSMQEQAAALASVVSTFTVTKGPGAVDAPVPAQAPQRLALTGRPAGQDWDEF